MNLSKEQRIKLRLFYAQVRLVATILISIVSAWYLLNFLIYENILDGITAIIFILLLKDEK